MNRQRAKELLPIIQAFADGAVIQTKYNDQEDTWFDTPDPEWYPNHDHRIKPKPRELWVMVYNNKTPSPCFSSSHETEKAATDYMQTLQKDNPIMFDDAYVVKVREVIE